MRQNASLNRCKEKKCMVSSCGKCQRHLIKIRPRSGLGKVTWPPGHPRGTPGNTRGMVHFWQFFGRAGWGHCLVLERNASDPRDTPPGFGRHWSAVHGFQNPGWTACRHLYSISWICCTFVLHHAVVQSLGCFTKKKKVCYCRQFRWIRCERWA